MTRDKVVDGIAQGPYLAFLLLHLASKTLLVVHNTDGDAYVCLVAFPATRPLL